MRIPVKTATILILMSFIFLNLADFSEAKGRKGSKRYGGTNSHGKGSHYVGGRR